MDSVVVRSRIVMRVVGWCSRRERTMALPTKPVPPVTRTVGIGVGVEESVMVFGGGVGGLGAGYGDLCSVCFENRSLTTRC